MAQVIVHIGQNKTGSTTIQRWLKSNAAALARQGIKYDPLEAGSDRLPHLTGFQALSRHINGLPVESDVIRFRYGIDGPEAQAHVVDEFETRATASFGTGDFETYVISSEALCVTLHDKATIEKFIGFLERHFDRVQVTAYVRDQVDWMPSAYSEGIKSGHSESLAAYLKRAPMKNLNAFAVTWCNAIGADRFNIRLLEPDYLTNGDLLSDFAAVVGADAEHTTKPPPQNEGFGRFGLGVMRMVNRSERVLPLRSSTRLRLFARKHLRKLPATGKVVLSSEQARQVAMSHAVSNENLRKRFFPERPILFAKSARILEDIKHPGRAPAAGSEETPVAAMR